MATRALNIALLLFGVATGAGPGYAGDEWSDREVKLITTLSLSKLPNLKELPKFGSNRYAFDARAQRLGEKLFFDQGLSHTGETSCATCHAEGTAYASPRLITTKDRGIRSVPTLLGVGWLDFYFWDGRADSLWSLAIGPLTSPKEHDLSPEDLRRRVVSVHRDGYTELFGDPTNQPPAQILANVGKAIEAYVLTIKLEPGPLDVFADRLAMGEVSPKDDLAPCAKRGLKLFVGKGTCVNCHNGPTLSNGYFHNIGVPLADLNDVGNGRQAGDEELVASPFTCVGPYSDAPDADKRRVCAESMHAGGSMLGAYKTPTLRAVSKTPPYMHNGIYRTLKQVLFHYNQRLSAPIGDAETLPLGLSDEEVDALECFLGIL